MSDDSTFHAISKAAEWFSLTVRTLHHWEARGLLTPAERSWSNYRLYSAEDHAHAQGIIIHRVTGMRLMDIKTLLGSGESRVSRPRRQREELIAHRQETDKMIEALDTLLEDAMNDNALTVKQIGEALRDAGFVVHQVRTEECYGEVDDWREWHRYTASWQAGGWQVSTERIRRIESGMIDAVHARVTTDSDRAIELVDAHRGALSEYFPVSPAKHYLISHVCLCNRSLRSHHDSQQEGFAQWLTDTIEHAAVARGVDTGNPQWR